MVLNVRARGAVLLSLLLSTLPIDGGVARAMTGKKDADYEWLEDLQGEKSLAWVRQQNDRSLKELRATPTYEGFKSEALKILQAKDKLAFGVIEGSHVYNFWQDADHVRGIWRRTSWDAYARGKPEWETMLDIDALGAKEGKSYVYGGSQCLAPTYQRCLVRLSEGGSDASSYREFDTATKSFVEGGFTLPASKSSLAWIDTDRVLLNTALEASTQTDSGYPMEVRIWKRGESWKTSPVLLKGEKSDVAVDGYGVHDQGQMFNFVARALSFYTAEIHYLKGEKLIKLPLPVDVEVKGLYRGQMLLSNRSPIESYPAGALLSVDLADMVAKGKPTYQLVFAPTSRQSLAGIDRGLDYVYVRILDEVRSKVMRFSYEKDKSGQGWVNEALPLEDKGTISLVSVDEWTNRLLLSYEDFIVPESLYAMDGKERTKQLIAQVPARFQSNGLVIRQEFATSKDGTKVPYFLVHRQGIELKGQNPTLLYGYGGFEVSMQPSYAEVRGKLWFERGGVFALANIRGGGEFGPTWHQAALQEHRQRAFDDFAAVAEDLIKKKITSPAHLGIQGGSNGGLLMGASFTQRPDLFGAVICQVPLLDMLRYHKLLAGASWVAEYGSPDDPRMADVIRRYSPFQNLDEKKTYPEVFFVTSTKDDRVHPGHARKMAARMADLKKPFLYYENIEGGHSASADLVQAAERAALEYSYLWLKLSGKGPVGQPKVAP